MPGPTLLDDWCARSQALQKQLTNANASSPRDYAETELRILQFLIKRYAQTAEGLSPAQFPLNTGALYYSRSHCIEQRIRELTGKAPQKPKNEQEARARVSCVLKRFSSREDAPVPSVVSLEKQAVLPTEEADQRVVAQSVTAWKIKCYQELSERSSYERLSATHRLAHCGTLDDISMLSDLLKVPPSAREDPAERPMLLWAIRIIAIRNSGETYIPGVSDAATAPSSSNSS